VAASRKRRTSSGWTTGSRTCTARTGCERVVEAADLCPMSAIIVTAQTEELAA
jgi:hypothetical protein